MKRTLLILSLVAIGSANVFANDLWNQTQSSYNYINGSVNQVRGQNDGFDAYQVSDVIASQGWNVNQISVDFITNGSGLTLGQQLGVTLNVFTNTGALPSAANDPTAGTPYTATISAMGTDGNFGLTSYTLTLTGLNLSLAAGEYWIGMTPSINSATYGQSFEGLTTTNSMGANYNDAWINPSGGFNLGTTWSNVNTATGDSNGYYGGIDIQGTTQSVPEPASIAALGFGLIGLISRRRRNS